MNKVVGPSVNAHQVGGEHYKPGSSYQHWDYCVANNLGYLEGQLTRYLSRWRTKNGIQDLEKAAHYADKLAELAHIRCNQKPYRLKPAPASGILSMIQLYDLTENEQAVFKLVAEYQTAEELYAVQRLCRTILEEALGAVQG